MSIIIEDLNELNISKLNTKGFLVHNNDCVGKKEAITNSNLAKPLEESSKSEQPSRVTFSDSMKQLLKSSSIHGISHMFVTKRIQFQVMWILLFAVSSCGCTYYVYKSVLDFLSYETDTKISSITEIVQQFPTVSLCSYYNSSFQFQPLSIAFNFQDITKDWKNHFEVYNDTRYGQCYRFNSGRNFTGHSIPIKFTTSIGNIIKH